MEWTKSAEPNGFTLVAPDAADTWDALRPYLTAGWAKLLGDLPTVAPPISPAPRLSLIIDGREGAAHVWMVLAGGGQLPAAVADPSLATGVYLRLPGYEALAAGADDWEAVVCQLADEVLAAVTRPPAAGAAAVVLDRYAKIAISHDAIDPEHGWYKPFRAKLADLVAGKRPKVRWIHDFDMG